jgi:signal transduction histidine kinase
MLRSESKQGAVSPAALKRFDQVAASADFDYLEQEIPSAIDQCLEGLNRVAGIVKAMKEFSHPGSEDKTPTDINRAIETTVAVARNEWKYVSEVVTELQNGLPLVPCLQGELKQVILNLIVNAAQAIAGALGDGSRSKGKITIRTRQVENEVEIAVQDTGLGIRPEIRSRIFEPFFTTKPVGKGTGQGLSLAHATIVKRHQGKIYFESEVGQGSTFFIRLPIATCAAAAAGV